MTEEDLRRKKEDDEGGFLIGGEKVGQVVRSAKNIYDVRARPTSAGRIVGRQRLKEQFMHASDHHFSFLYGSLHLLFDRHGRAASE